MKVQLPIAWQEMNEEEYQKLAARHGPAASLTDHGTLTNGTEWSEYRGGSDAWRLERLAVGTRNRGYRYFKPDVSLRAKLALISELPESNIRPLFVYGTLKRGHGNHTFLQDAELLASCAEVDGFTLYGSTIPYMVRSPGDRVKGEVYAVDDEILGPIDRLEGHPNHYRREPVPLVNGVGSVWAYLVQREHCWSGRLGSVWPKR